jgi:hypothetical protein
MIIKYNCEYSCNNINNSIVKYCKDNKIQFVYDVYFNLCINQHSNYYYKVINIKVEKDIIHFEIDLFSNPIKSEYHNKNNLKVVI